MGSWRSEDKSNSKINDVIKAILLCSQTYVPLAQNPANALSRQHPDLGCTLSEKTWSRVQKMFEPHTFDVMSLDSNCHCDQLGIRLPHFTPYHTPESPGINVFSQQLPIRENIYVFPPFVLIGPLCRSFIDQHYRRPFTIIVLDLQPRRYWWALLQTASVDRLVLERGRRFSFVFPLLLRLQVGSLDGYIATCGLFVASVK